MHTHHAIVSIATTLSESAVPETYHTQSADISHIDIDRLAIADVRKLIRAAQQRPVEAECRVFVIVTKVIPIDSQNALLKLFEEPPLSTTFYLVIPQEGILIPTLRSRVQFAESTQTHEIHAFFSEFLTMSYADRLQCIAELTKQKDRVRSDVLVSGAEIFASKHVQEFPDIAKVVLLVREYIQMSGASRKMLLEELALSLPVQ